MATWDATFNVTPSGASSPRYGDDRIRETRVETCNRADQEHVWLNTSSTGQSIHRQGSARVYYVDAEQDEETGELAAAPDLRPDDTTSLGLSDDGRLLVDSATDILYHWTGSEWKATTVYDLVNLDVPTWHKIDNPTPGWLASKTSGWVADRFTAVTGGMEIDFSDCVTEGTTIVKVFLRTDHDELPIYGRPAGDDDYASNTPYSNEERFATLFDPYASSGTSRGCQVELLLNDEYKAEIAVADTGCDVNISYPYLEFY